MYTGIVQHITRVLSCEAQENFLRYSIDLGPIASGVQLGASVNVDGVCQTVVRIEGSVCWFEVIDETLDKTTLDKLQVGRKVNVERSMRFGDEVGGHLMAGHVNGTAVISERIETPNNVELVIRCDASWTKYILPKGYIAVDGISLTVGRVSDDGYFHLHLIPETLDRTTLGFKLVGDRVNIELDYQTQAIVTTVERLMESRYPVPSGESAQLG